MLHAHVKIDLDLAIFWPLLGSFVDAALPFDDLDLGFGSLTCCF